MSDYSNWMRDIWDHIKTREMWRILLPGTHNSGVFSALNTWPVRCQDKNIFEQLAGGIRCFDIRVTNTYFGSIAMHHQNNYPGWPSHDQDLWAALDQMNRFVESHDHEMLVIMLWSGGGSPSWNVVGSMITGTLGDKLVPWEGDEASYTLESIRASGKRIMVLCDELNQANTHSSLFWPYSRIANTYADWQTAGLSVYYERDRKLGDLNDHITSVLRGLSEDSSRQFVLASYILWGGHIYDDAVSINQVLPEWLAKSWEEASLREALNVITVDFFDSPNNEVVPKIIELNTRR